MTDEVEPRLTVNRELLLKVKAKILAEPAQFEMEYLFKGRDSFGYLKIAWAAHERAGFRPLTAFLDVPREVPNCGTAACIAGWAVAVHLGENPMVAESKFNANDFNIRSLLGLAPDCTCLNDDMCMCECDHQNSDRFDSLCYVHGWPKEQREAWRATTDLEARARLAAEVIELRLAQWAAEDEKQEEVNA